jgi:hypothetical protein
VNHRHLIVLYGLMSNFTIFIFYERSNIIAKADVFVLNLRVFLWCGIPSSGKRTPFSLPKITLLSDTFYNLNLKLKCIYLFLNYDVFLE